MNGEFRSEAALPLVRSRVADFLTLTKPELTFLSVLTALGGAYLAGLPGPTSMVDLLHVMVGTLLLGGGAGALNQYIERHYDALMKRTERRPLPAGRISAGEGLAFGVWLSLSGLLYLLVSTNPLTAAFGLITLTSYLFLYTPLKRMTWLSTLVGGIPGALPPVMGWTAIRNEVSMEALVLFGILFFWQMPHFFSLAWMYRDDYRAGGYKMLPVLDPSGTRTSLQITLHLGLLLAAAFLLGIVSALGGIYLVGSFVLSSFFLWTGILFSKTRSTRFARLVFFGSLAYLPALLALVIIDRL
jgi:protoheme IX farnesyltransferase